MPRAPRAYLVLIVLTSLHCLAACEPDADGPLGISAVAIAEDPGAYYGSRVTVSGQVNDVFSPGTFTIGGGEFGNEVLVLSLDSIRVVPERAVEQPIRRGDLVQVTGIAQRFDEVRESDHSGFDPTDLEDEFGGTPVIVSRRAGARLEHVVVTPRQIDAAVPGDDELLTDFSGLTGDSARELVGRAVHFRDVKAVEHVGRYTFWAAVDSDSLFVVLVPGATDDESQVEVDTNRTWELYGVLKEVPPPNRLAADWALTDTTISRLEPREVYLEAIHAIRSDEINVASQ